MKRKVKVSKPCYECGGQTYQQGGGFQSAPMNMIPTSDPGNCTGSNFGGPNCPKGSPQYEMVKTTRKLNKEKKKVEGPSIAEQGAKIDTMTSDRNNMFKKFIGNKATQAIAEEEMLKAMHERQMQQFNAQAGGAMHEMPDGTMMPGPYHIGPQAYQDAGQPYTSEQENYGYNPDMAQINAYLGKQAALQNQNNQAMQDFTGAIGELDYGKKMKIKSIVNPTYATDPSYQIPGFAKDGGDNSDRQHWLNTLAYGQKTNNQNAIREATSRLKILDQRSQDEKDALQNAFQSRYKETSDSLAERQATYDGFVAANDMNDPENIYKANNILYLLNIRKKQMKELDAENVYGYEYSSTTEPLLAKDVLTDEFARQRDEALGKNIAAEEAQRKEQIMAGTDAQKPSASTNAADVVEAATTMAPANVSRTKTQGKSEPTDAATDAAATVDEGAKANLQQPNYGFINPNRSANLFKRPQGPIAYNIDNTYLSKAEIDRKHNALLKRNANRIKSETYTFTHGVDGSRPIQQQETVSPEDPNYDNYISRATSEAQAEDAMQQGRPNRGMMLTRPVDASDESVNRGRMLTAQAGLNVFSRMFKNDFRNKWSDQDLGKTEVKFYDGVKGADALVGPGMDVLSAVGRGITEPRINMEDFTSADQLYTAGMGDRGKHTFNPSNVIDPSNMTPVQFTGMAQQGGTPDYAVGSEYEMSDAEIAAFIQAGGQIEYI